MKLNEFIKIYTPKIRKQIILNLEQARKSQSSPISKQSVDYILQSSISGKMMRGNLFLITSYLHKKEITKDLLDVASAIEILQTGLLIHDDVMDHDLKRRNLDSVYASYIKQGESKLAENPEQYGASMAICAGDISYFLVFEILSKLRLENDVILKLISKVASELHGVGIGQMMDVEFSNLPIEPSFDDIENINLLKTARYTFLLPMIMACIVCRKENVSQFENLGLHMGAIFQLRDDELGLMGNQEEIGKSIGSDIRENKKTILRKLLFELVSKSELDQISALFGKKIINMSEIQSIIDLVNKYDIQNKVAAIIEKHKKQSEVIIKDIKSDGLDVKMLEEMLNFVYIRKK